MLPVLPASGRVPPRPQPPLAAGSAAKLRPPYNDLPDVTEVRVVSRPPSREMIEALPALLRLDLRLKYNKSDLDQSAFRQLYNDIHSWFQALSPEDLTLEALLGLFEHLIVNGLDSNQLFNLFQVIDKDDEIALLYNMGPFESITDQTLQQAEYREGIEEILKDKSAEFREAFMNYANTIGLEQLRQICAQECQANMRYFATEMRNHGLLAQKNLIDPCNEILSNEVALSEETAVQQEDFQAKRYQLFKVLLPGPTLADSLESLLVKQASIHRAISHRVNNHSACVVCTAAPRGLRFSPCGHVVVCTDCFGKLSQPARCPMCRSEITEGQHVYF